MPLVAPISMTQKMFVSWQVGEIHKFHQKVRVNSGAITVFQVRVGIVDDQLYNRPVILKFQCISWRWLKYYRLPSLASPSSKKPDENSFRSIISQFKHIKLIRQMTLGFVKPLYPKNLNGA